MSEISQTDDEREPLSDDEIERLAHPTSGVRRYDRRAVAQSLREQRKRERELRRIDRTWRKIAESLEGKDDIQSKRLLYEITKDQRDRIEGKPFIAENPAPKKKANAFQDDRLQLAVQNLIMPRTVSQTAPARPSPPQLEARPEPASPAPAPGAGQDT